MLLTVIAFILILSVLVLIHEFGHFIVAKKLGIKVEEFGVGFPPRAISKKIGETVYSINWLPVGGFVKLYGEDDAGGGKIGSRITGEKSQEDLQRAFYARPLWQRMTVVTAGVIMNFILAVVVLSFLFATQGVPLPTEHVKIREVSHASPAEVAGLRVNDQIVSLNGLELKDTDKFIKETQKRKGEEVTLVVLRNGQEFTTKIIPRSNPPKGQGAMGVAITNVEVKKYSWIEAPFYGTMEAVKFSWMIVQGLGSMIGDFVLHGIKPQGVAGPIGVAQLTGEAVRAGWFAVLWFLSLLSLNLAVLNILPIPALDGGRFFFMIIEMVTGKKVSPRYEAYAHGAGLVALLALMALITVFDVLRLIQGKGILP
jgi:regulator of sigma E protease